VPCRVAVEDAFEAMITDWESASYSSKTSTTEMPAGGDGTVRDAS
jgi:hypothetical protein